MLPPEPQSNPNVHPGADPVPPHPPTSLLIGKEGLRPAWGLLLFVVLFLTLSIAAQAITTAIFHNSPKQTANPEQTPVHLFLTEGTSLAAVLLTTLILARVEHRPFPTYGLASPSRLPLFTKGLLSGIFTLSLLVATLHLTGHLAIDARRLPNPEALRYGLVWAIAFALVAFLEETLLRGYLQYTLTRALTPIVEATFKTPKPQTGAFWAAATLLSILFGLGHTSNPGESSIGLLSAFLAGLVFSFALYRTGSLWWALGFHTSWDWAQSFLYGTPDSGLTIQHHLFATHPTGPTIFSGGLTGPEGSIFVLPTLAVVAAIILRTLTRRDLHHVTQILEG